MNWLEAWVEALGDPTIQGHAARVEFLLILIVALLVAILLTPTALALLRGRPRRGAPPTG